MTILTDEEIIERCSTDRPMIFPFVTSSVSSVEVPAEEGDDIYVADPNRPLVFGGRLRYEGDARYVKPKKVLSYGPSSHGYDVRVADEFKIFTNVNSTVVDPKNFDKNSFVDFKGDVCIVPPNSFALCRTMEHFIMPRDITGVVLGKSTYARTGLHCLATPMESGWEGELVLEFANTTPLPIKLYANEGAAQILFFQGKVPCRMSYADRHHGEGGKYQGQKGITLPKV